MMNSQTDREFFEKIYMQHRTQMARIANQVLQNAEDTEDAVHTAFVSMAYNIEHLRGRSEDDIRNYVLRTA